MNKQKTAGVMAGCLVAACAAQGQTVLFNQLYNSSQITGSVVSCSDFPYGVGEIATFDNFELATPGTVNTVDWLGEFAYPGTPDVTGFSIDFYANNGGSAGALLASDTISGTAGQTVDPNLGGYIYDYSADLSTPFSASAGTEYWISIVGDNNGSTLFYMPTGPNEGGNGDAYFSDQGNYDVGGGVAFSLIQNATPVPDGGETVALLGLTVAGLSFIKRKAR